MIGITAAESAKGLRKSITAAIVFLVLCLVCAAPAGAETLTDTWDGTINESWYSASDGSFEITTAEELAGLASLTNKGIDFTGWTFTLGADLNLNGTNHLWIPIGNYTEYGSNRHAVFNATFDGNGHSVSGMNVSGYHESAGLFGVVESGGVVKCLSVEGTVDVTGSSAGGIAGENKGTISECYSACEVNAVTDDSTYAGGIVGLNYGKIRSINDGPEELVVGYITNCFATESVSAQGESVFSGGIAGQNEGSIISCYATGVVTAESTAEDGYARAGGIAGFNLNYNEEYPSLGLIKNCYALNEEVTADATYPFAGKISVDWGITTDSYEWEGMVTNGDLDASVGTEVSSADIWDTNFVGFDYENDIWRKGTDENFKLPVLEALGEPAGADASYLKKEVRFITLEGGESPSGMSGSGNMDPLPVLEENSAILPDSTFTNTGYAFTNWNTKIDRDGTDYAVGAEIVFENIPVDGLTLYAQWRPITYFIQFNNDTGYYCQTATFDEYTKLTSNTFTAPEGKYFNGWAIEESGEAIYADNAEINARQFYLEEEGENGEVNYIYPIQEEGDVLMLYAVWTENAPVTYTVTFDSNGGSAVEPQSVLSGQHTTYPAEPTRIGYTFRGWYYGDEPYLFVLDDPVNADIVLTADWIPNTYDVLFYNESTEYEADSQTLTYDTLETLKPIENIEDIEVPAGKVFGGWATTSDGEAVYANNATVKNLAEQDRADVKLYAVWVDENSKPEVHKVVFTHVINWPADITETVLNNTLATEPNVPTRLGYAFVAWEKNGAGIPWNFAEDRVTSDVLLIANWTGVPTFTVSFEENGGTHVENQTVNNDTKAVTPAEPTKSNHIFDGWYSDAACTAEYVFNIPVTADITLYAKWIEIVYPPSSDDDDSYTPPTPTPTPTPTVTPTPTPTEEPTVVTTDVVPTEIPTEQPTEPGTSPAPVLGMVLGGLAAFTVLRRK